MPINPIQFAHSVCDEFLRYIHSAFPLTDPNLAAQARRMFEAPSSLGIQTRGETLMAAASPAPALRGHHLLCILGFRGLGYDEAFVANMTRVVGIIRKKPETVFTFTDSADILCAACPRYVNGRCQSDLGAEDRARERDRAVLRALELESGDSLPAGRVYDRIRERISLAAMEQICAGCEWQSSGYCAEGLAALKESGRFYRA